MLNSCSKSYLTAIGRKKLPAPTQWLLKNGLVLERTRGCRTLDFGCGRCYKVNPLSWHNYDPHFATSTLLTPNSFNRIVCNYVLCTVTEDEQVKILEKIKSLLWWNATAYITVRRSEPKHGWGLSSTGTLQRYVILDLPIVHENSNFCIYRLTKERIYGKIVP